MELLALTTSRRGSREFIGRKMMQLKHDGVGRRPRKVKTRIEVLNSTSTNVLPADL